MVMGYFRLLGNRAYMAYTLSGVFFTGGMFTYIAATPFVYIEYFGISPQLYGLLFGINVVGMMVFNVVNRRLVLAIGSDRSLVTRALACAAFGLTLAVLGATGELRSAGGRRAAILLSGNDGAGGCQRHGRRHVGGARHGGGRFRAGRHGPVRHGSGGERACRLAVGRHARPDGAGDRG